MPRLAASSTAIAVLFSVGIGLPAQSEVVLDAGNAAEAGSKRAEAMPGLNGLLQAELRAGLKAGQLSCLDGSARPCADDMPLVTPAGVAVQLSETGEMILAANELQAYRIADGAPVVRDTPLKGLAEARLDQSRAGAAAALAAPAKAAEAPEAPKPAAEKPAEVKPAPAKTADAPAEKDPVAENLRNSEGMKKLTGGDDQKQLDELAKQLAAAAATGDEKKPAEPAKAQVKDSHAGAEARIAPADAKVVQPRRSTNMPMLQRVLEQEIAAGLTADDLLCIDGSKRPCAAGVTLVSPKGVSVEVTQNGRIILAAMAQQQYTVGEDGKLRARGSNTAAAKEAAEAAKPTAAALATAGNAKGEVVTETVTEDNVRSSDQDFETRIADAIRQAAAQQPESRDSGSDGGSDLAKLALAGLGALAVGQVLQGNREVALNTGDRVVVTRADGSQQVLKDDNMLLRQAGNEVQTENFADGSSRTVVKRPDGSQVITIRGADLGVLRRIHIAADGRETVLIDEAVEVPPVQVAELPPAPKPSNDATPTTEEALRAALAREAAVSRRFTLNQIRSIPEVRNLVAPVDINAITFNSGSAAINPDQARQLATLGTVLEDAVKANPREIFLIEGHTDAVGSATYNLALSDRRAESVALALSEYFDVPPENLVVQGYGEEYLKIPVLDAERENRRASVRRITDLLASAQ